MPSPIAHIAAGIAVGMIAKQKAQPSKREPLNRTSQLIEAIEVCPYIFLAVFASILPDFDSIVGLLLGDFAKYHNNLSHSFVFGFGICLLFTSVFSVFITIPKKVIFLTLFTAYIIHILMDAAAITRGVMVLWPFTEHRFTSPLSIFYGVRWSEGVFAWQHLISIFTELIFVVILFAIIRWYVKK